MITDVQGSATRLIEPPRERAGDDVWVARFGRTERFAHWWTVLMIMIALLTGLSMGDESGGAMLWPHIGSVALIVIGLAAAAVLGDHRALLRSARHVFTFDARDRDWLRARIQHPFQRHPHLHWGQFNTGQKLLAWALSASILAVIGTGIVSWRSGGEGGLHGPAVVVTVILLGAHIFMAVVNPATRPALTGIVFGRVRRSWAVTHHRAWLDEVEGSGGDS
jgi:cytochrome b subunit of formate dehydrogenase